MKIIKDNNNFSEFFSLADGEQFIWKPSEHFEFFAVKVAENAIVITGSNKFIAAKCYKNCLSIGGGLVREYDDFSTALQNLDRDIARL